MPAPLRLATWNCRMGLDRKRHLVEHLGADVVVIPECSRSNQLQHELGISSAWHGRYDRKGLGVFALNGWTLEHVRGNHATPWSLPLHVLDPDGDEAFILVATWTIGSDRSGGLGYASQISEVIAHWEREIRDGRVVIAGDFNCSAQTADPTAHLANVRWLASLGMQSAYHSMNGLPHGMEEDMTLRWVGRGRVEQWFHCDFIYLPRRLDRRATNASVGAPDDWIGAGLSDHAPVICDIAPASPLDDPNADPEGPAARRLVIQLLGRYRERFGDIPGITIPTNDQIALPQAEFHGTVIGLTVVYRVVATDEGLELEYLELSKFGSALNVMRDNESGDLPVSSEYDDDFADAVIARGMVPQDGSEWIDAADTLAPASKHQVIKGPARGQAE